MIMLIVFNKIKQLVLLIVGVFRRALCCLRRRRRSSVDSVPLTHVGVVLNDAEQENWTWEERNEFSEPKTIQDHIELYRKKKIEASNQMAEEAPEDFFEDMAPRITRQTKLYVNNGHGDDATNGDVTSRLNFAMETAPVETGELREWEESAGWEGQTLDWDAQEALREKKRQDRERKMWEQQQKRQEKINRSLGAKVTT